MYMAPHHSKRHANCCWFSHWTLPAALLLLAAVAVVFVGKQGNQAVAAAVAARAAAEETATAAEQALAEALAPPAAKRDESERRLAPELDGGGAWLNTAGPIQMKDLRGKIVILDFWTLCCIN